jgi:hypothetical protein
MIVARILRLAFVLAVVAVVLVLFAYAFLAALILVPVLALLFFLFGKKYGNVWVVGGPGFRRENTRSRDGKSPPPVIDHDPNDLPPTDTQGDGR